MIIDEITDEHDYFEETASRDATKQEIEELALVMAEFGICFSDVADNCPRQERTIKACSAAISFAAEKQELLDELLRTKKTSSCQTCFRLWNRAENTGTSPEIHIGNALDLHKWI